MPIPIWGIFNRFEDRLQVTRDRVRDGSGKPTVPFFQRDEDLQRTARPAGARPKKVSSRKSQWAVTQVNLKPEVPGLCNAASYLTTFAKKSK
ncbi:hypothetical protein HYN49_10430 [Flavobacterium pallidum]|uniref:Uncharacterized protein n=1 Tax=Flavobacterium pallidum TaxID=2172098 RepID=A0A2S1SIN9_9FLAO|nr:hypothetical protein HYN49_10430 [Flavobacterium pallidum]